MNEEQIEKVLRAAPPVKVPAGLLEKLKGEIALPPQQSRKTESVPIANHGWLKLWIPALSFAAFFISCLVVVGVQTNTLSELRRENDRLRTAAQGLEALRTQNVEYQRLYTQSQSMEQLRKDNAELHRLKEEVEKLRVQASEVEKLQAENQKLQAMNAAASQQAGAAAGGSDFFAEAEAKADCIHCINNLKQIGLAARIWSNDRGGNLPSVSDFLSMTNELATPKILICPADKSRKTPDWSDVAAGGISYRMSAPGVDEGNPNAVYVECPLHGNILLVDGSVQKLGTNYASKLKMENGRMVLSR
ncbi:hypothetical protein [Pedosphaera parvula]|uniref:Uncharacterized protein n=1 Tax=Pedosphaera parvula (strain Ellin514) TaxID=320771 RepID=B9XGS7_PEDPL|nr:hypothetical protein [Pedosphaera parvula]EEF60848.1 hypothetical protein Cflav_PD4017 [Pedosphaera parvula Ellin514]